MVTMSGPLSGTQRLEREVSLQLLRGLAASGGGVGRVAYVQDGVPVLRPVTYAVDDTGILLVTHALSGLAGAVGTVVCFEVDELEPALCAGWSVVVTGSLEPAHSGTTVDPWADGDRHTHLRLGLDELSGLRIQPGPGGVR